MRAARECFAGTGRDGETSLPKSRGGEHCGLNSEELNRFAVLGRIPCWRSSLPMQIGKGSYNMCCLNQTPCAPPMGRVRKTSKGQNAAAPPVYETPAGRNTEFLVQCLTPRADRDCQPIGGVRCKRPMWVEQRRFHEVSSVSLATVISDNHSYRSHCLRVFVTQAGLLPQ
jgi:hypothetical protein